MCILGTLDLVPKMQCMWLLHPAVEHHPLLYCTSVSCHNHNKEERFIIIYQLDILKKQIFIKIPFSEVTWLLPIGQKLVVTNRDTTVFVSWQLLCYTRPARVFAIKKHRHVTTSTKYTQIMGTITIMTKYCPCIMVWLNNWSDGNYTPYNIHRKCMFMFWMTSWQLKNF